MAQRRSVGVAFAYAAGLPARWVAAGEVCGRSGGLRRACEQAGLAYVLIIPCDHQVITAAGAVTRADQAAADAVFERRSCGTGVQGPPDQRLGADRHR